MQISGQEHTRGLVSVQEQLYASVRGSQSTYKVLNKIFLRLAVHGFLVFHAFNEVRVVATLPQLHLDDGQAGLVGTVTPLSHHKPRDVSVHAHPHRVSSGEGAILTLYRNWRLRSKMAR